MRGSLRFFLYYGHTCVRCRTGPPARGSDFRFLELHASGTRGHGCLKAALFSAFVSELSLIFENSLKGGIQGEISAILQLKALVKSLPDDDHRETADAYLHVIDLLYVVLLESEKAGENQPYLALLFSWPVLLSPKFLSFLSIQEPVSLIIMAHFAGILGHKKDFWWITCWNTCILNDVESRLSPDLLEWLVWPRQMCGDQTG